MSNDVNELRVFVASPSDLDEERAALRDLESDLNNLFATANLRVRVTGWEQRSPGYGRPQAQINPMVDDCDIFIGLLRRKWGSDTGTHDSGFGEEFERALNRRRKSGSSPEISLYFAHLSQDELDDAGPELKRVLKFKHRVRDEKVGIYSTFTGPADLGRQVQRLLEGHLVNLMVSQSSTETPSGPERPPDDANAPVASDVEDATGRDSTQEDAQSQLSQTLIALQDVLSDSEPRHTFDRDRLELIGTALGRDTPTLGAHLTNRLYRRRGELQLIVAEHTVWMRTLLADVGRSGKAANHVIPGWAIIDPHHDSFKSSMLRSAMESGPVGIGALRSMMRLGMRPALLWPTALRPQDHLDENPGSDVRLDNWTNVLNGHKGRSVALDYLLQDIDTDDRARAGALDDLLAALAVERGDLNDESRELIVYSRAALSGDPGPLAESLGYSSEANAQWRLVLRQAEKLDPKLLNRLANQTFNRDARMGALRASIAANCLSDHTVKQLLFEDQAEVIALFLEAAQADPEVATRYLRLLEEKPEGKFKPTGLEAKLLAVSFTFEELEALDAEQKLSNVAWEALTYRSSQAMAVAARVTLQTDAADYRARLLNIIGEEHELIDYLADDRKRVAAALLSRREGRSSEDVDLVLAWFEHEAAGGFVRGHALEALQNVADGPTLPRIAEILTRYRESSGLRASPKHMHGPLAPVLANLFIDHESTYYREPAMVWHTSQESRSDAELVEALYDESDTVRAVAVSVLAQRLSDEALLALLEDYPSAGRAYWYNVIAMLDERVYAPSLSLEVAQRP